MDDLHGLIKVTESGCHEWQGGRFTSGYGQVKLGGRRRPFVVHRALWIMANGPIPDGLLVCHHCDNPPCVRLDHLFLGTHQDNMDDMVAKDRARQGDRTGAARGERHTNAKLSDADVVALRETYNAGGVTQVELAKRYGVSGALVSQIVRGLHRGDSF